MAGTTPYLGSKISLISRLDIRYEGTLYSVDPVDSTIALSQVRSFGTEDRPSIVPVPARAEVYEFIIFKASDIKDLIVCEVAKPTPAVDDIHYDPAIVSVSRPPPPVQQPPPQQQDSQASSPQGQVPAQFPHPVNIPPPQPRPPQRQSAAESTGRFSNRPQQQRSYYSRAVQQPAQQQNQQRQYYPRQQQQQVSDGQGQQNRRAPYVQQNRAPPVYHRAPAQRGGERPKFEGDFDFEKANEQLAEMNLNEDEKSSNQSVPESEEQADDRKVSDKGVMDAAGENFYDRTTSFFDNISCDALEREEGKSCRVDWKKERVTNQETFGTTAVNRNYGRGGGRAYRGGGYNYGQQNYYRNNQRYNNNNPRQHQPAQQQRQQMHY